MYKEIFINAIREKRKIFVTFFSKEDRRVIRRTCAPMDYGPSRIEKRDVDRYHMWDYDSDSRKHPLMLLPEQIKDMEVLNEHFEPSEFVQDHWKLNWKIKRDWGKYS